MSLVILGRGMTKTLRHKDRKFPEVMMEKLMMWANTERIESRIRTIMLRLILSKRTPLDLIDRRVFLNLSADTLEKEKRFEDN